jgi:alkylhydroperoxidase family enzyme
MVDLHRDRPEWGDERPEQLFERLSASPEIGDAFLRVGDTLYRELDGRALDLISLRVASLRHNMYTWHGHVWIGRRRAALSDDDIRRVAAGPDHLTGTDRLVVQAVDDLLTLNRLGGSTARALGDDAVMYVIAISFYDLVTRIMRGADPDAPVTAGFETPALAASGLGR